MEPAGVLQFFGQISLGSIIGWFASNWYKSYQDARNRKREQHGTCVALIRAITSAATKGYAVLGNSQEANASAITFTIEIGTLRTELSELFDSNPPQNVRDCLQAFSRCGDAGCIDDPLRLGCGVLSAEIKALIDARDALIGAVTANAKSRYGV